MSITQLQLIVSSKQLTSATAEITYAVPAGGYNGVVTSQFAETVSTYNGNSKLQWDLSSSTAFSGSGTSTLMLNVQPIWKASTQLNYGKPHDTYTFSAQEVVSNFLLDCSGTYGGNLNNW